MSSHQHKSGCYATNLSLRNDPTKTLEVRNNFAQDMRGRFRRVKGAIGRTIGYENDAFGLAQNKIDSGGPYDFPTDKGKIDAFIRDLKSWLQGEILETATQTELREGQHWTSEYIRNSYLIGRNVAIGRLKQKGASVENLPNQELIQTRTSIKTLRDLYTRAYENLKDITDDTADVIREELTKGFAQGENPKKLAKRITDRTGEIQHTRAETLTQTETINAATDASFDEYRKAGVDTVGHGEWLTSMDESVCPFCRRLSGKRFKISEMDGSKLVIFRGQEYRLGFPAHPRGRCCPTPVVGFSGELPTLGERVPGRIVA